MDLHVKAILVAVLLGAGAKLAWSASRRPEHRDTLELVGGVLIVAGLVSLGFFLALPPLR